MFFSVSPVNLTVGVWINASFSYMQYIFLPSCLNYYFHIVSIGTAETGYIDFTDGGEKCRVKKLLKEKCRTQNTKRVF